MKYWKSVFSGLYSIRNNFLNNVTAIHFSYILHEVHSSIVALLGSALDELGLASYAFSTRIRAEGWTSIWEECSWRSSRIRGVQLSHSAAVKPVFRCVKSHKCSYQIGKSVSHGQAQRQWFQEAWLTWEGNE